MDYKVLERPSDGLALVLTPKGERQLWARGILRNSRYCSNRGNCVICFNPLHAGESAYRPMGNTWNRYVRAHDVCVEGVRLREAS